MAGECEAETCHRHRHHDYCLPFALTWRVPAIYLGASILFISSFFVAMRGDLAKVHMADSLSRAAAAASSFRPVRLDRKVLEKICEPVGRCARRKYNRPSSRWPSGRDSIGSDRCSDLSWERAKREPQASGRPPRALLCFACLLSVHFTSNSEGFP